MSGILSYLLFDIQTREYIAGIDEKLLTAGRMAKSILPADYHDRIRDQTSVSPEDFATIVESLDRLGLDLGQLNATLRRERAVSAALAFLSMMGLGTLVILFGTGRMSGAVPRHGEDLQELVEERTAEIVAQKVRAEAALRAKSDFLANMSHEIRTPLNAVIGLAQLLERDRGLIPVQKEKAAAIARGGEHLLEVIDDVLAMSKLEAGRGAANPVTFALSAFLGDLRAMMAARAEVKGLRLVFEADPAIPSLIVADQGKLRQVLINLLANAIKFTEEGGVVLRARGEPREGGLTLVVEVEDSGKGIAAQDLETIFQPFEQTAVGVATGGTGLGLAIVREQLHRMGGTVAVASQPGHGSVFRVRVPVGEGRAGDPGPRPGRPAGRPPIDGAALARLPAGLAARLRAAVRAFQLTESRAILDELAAAEPRLAGDMRAALEDFDWDGLAAALGPGEAGQ